MTKVRAIIQARMLSTRLRGKSLQSIAGVPLLYRVVEAARKNKFVDDIIIATTKSKADDPIAAIAFSLGIGVFRGDSFDVLKRFKEAASDLEEEDTIMRITADNPIGFTEITTDILRLHQDGDYDYTHINGLSHLVPEFIKVRALREANTLASTEFDREHVTPFFRKNQETFRILTLPSDFKGLIPAMDRYLTVDTSEDLERMEKLFHYLEENELTIVPTTIYKWLEQEVSYVHQQVPDTWVVSLNGQMVGENYPTYIIAEIGQNHNGDMIIAKKLIDMAVRCKANAVKFQKRDIPSELTLEAYNKPYDSPNSFGRTYGEHRTFLELNYDQHLELKEYAMAQGITYFCTACDIPSVDLMEKLGNPFYKVASRDLTNIPLLERIAQTGKPVILSTGMASLTEIQDALSVLDNQPEAIAILQCTSQYPADIDNVNLNAMATLKSSFSKVVGFSDHTPGIIASVAASVMGASIIEKHITLSRAMKGSDQAGSLEEEGLRKMIEYIRLSERAKGNGIKEIDPSTIVAKEKLARSVTSRIDIPVGTLITEDQICLKSPGTGMSWKERTMILGKKAKLLIAKDVTLSEDMFE